MMWEGGEWRVIRMDEIKVVKEREGGMGIGRCFV